MDLHGLRVLIVDDDEDLSQLLSEVLELRGLRCMRLPTAEEAIAALAEADAVVTDVYLRGGSGIDLCGQIAAARPGLPVIVLSGDRAAKAAAMGRGASAFLVKPVDTARLIEALGQLLAR